MDTAMPQESICRLVNIGTLELQTEGGRTPDFNGVVVTEDKLLVIDYWANNLQVYRLLDGKLMYTSQKLESTPWGVCLINKTEVAVCLSNNTIVIMSFKSIDDVKLIKTLNIKSAIDSCLSVAKLSTSDKLVVIGWKRFILYRCVVSLTDGRVDSKHKVCQGLISLSHVAINNDTVYISCVTMEPTVTGVYAYDIFNPHTRKFLYQCHGFEPYSIMVDERNFIYVCGVNSNIIHQLTDTGKLVTIHIVSSRLLGIFYDVHQGVLYTTSEDTNVDALYGPGQGSKKITMYRLEYSHQPVVPAEVLKMDTRSVQMYRESLNDGKERVYNIRVMVVGQYGVGKTTLTQRLLGQNVNISERHSTDGIDVHVECCKVSMPAGEWTTQEKNAEKYSRLQRLVKILNQRAQKQESKSEQQGQSELDGHATSKKHDNVHSHYDQPVSAEPGTSQEVEPPTSQPVDSLIAEASSEREAKEKQKDTVMEILKLVNENSGNLEKSMMEYAALALWDFAGQYVFYTSHQTFLTSRAIYLLVIDLSQQVTDLVKDDEYFLDTEGIKLCKVHDLIEIWMNSIHSCTPSSQPSIPYVILVGTHVDKIPENIRQNVIDEYFVNVRKMLSDKPIVLHLMDDFAIDNTREDPRLEELKQRIFELSKQLPHWGEEKPARWLPLEQALMTLKASGVKVAPLSLIEEINRSQSVRIEDKDKLDLFLRYQHELGTILYFSIEGLKEKIVLDPQWLIDAQKSLITSETFIRRNPGIIGKWSEFKQSGKLTHELIDVIWSKEKNPEFHDNKDHIILLMEKLNIIARPMTCDQDGEEVKENYFLAPCMLRQETPREIICPEPDPQMESSSVLCFLFVGKYLPSPIFHRLLAACVERWRIAKQKKGEALESLIFCGCSVFQLDQFHKLTLYFRSHVIFMRVTRKGIKDKTPSSKLCMEVREFVTTNLIKIIGYLGQSLKFEYFIQCPKEPGDSIISLIPVSLLKENAEVCCECHDNIIESNNLLNVWFSDMQKSSSFEKSYSRATTKTPLLYNQELLSVVNKNEAGLMKAETDQIEAVFVHDQLVQRAKSVGIIRSPSVCGTGFRVGSCYVMTAYHVVDKIINAAAVPIQQQSQQHRQDVLSNINVFIDFSYEMNKLTTEDNIRFHFEPQIAYANVLLDTVILKLKHDATKKYPPALTSFTRSAKQGSGGYYFIGHPKADIKKTDKFQCVQLEPQQIIAAKEWSKKLVPKDDFVGIDDPCRVLLHCSFEGGASGAPGFWISPDDGKAYVLLMLLRGYPDWYYDDNYKDKRTGILPSYLIEQGVYMASIYDDMKRKNPSLCQEIFHFDDEDVEMS